MDFDVFFSTQKGNYVTVWMDRMKMRKMDGTFPKDITESLDVVVDVRKYVEDHHSDLLDDYDAAMKLKLKRFAYIDQKIK